MEPHRHNTTAANEHNNDAKAYTHMSGLWRYIAETSGAADDLGVDVLGMYNLTKGVEGWEGNEGGNGDVEKSYGVDVAVVQAMMVINWLDRLLFSPS
ncbi:hypothetical protein GX50_07595 [[Emmonsia] crescens]|uniref:Uncharacterized protein n=1 Tax=[Emmonsia] crescens TaxID=73230 RepID=A0A2B7YZX8_9EURO|nr:hypothetical protein GX50_07595 [Emmonsia crescens]